VGLTEAEVHELLSTLGRTSKRDELGFAREGFLGQFGVGMLSCFLVASSVTVITRSARSGSGVRWKADSSGNYTVSAMDGEVPIGTTVVLAASRGNEHWLEADVVPGSSSLLPQILVSLGERLVFSFWGQGLWVSDGTPAGTRKIHDRELDFFNAPLVWTVFEGRLYYAANGTLWSTDGTEAGTGPLLDRDGRTIFAPHRFAVLGDRLVFTAQDVLGPTLWESDGTPAGTFPVEPRVGINSPEELAGAGNRVFFPGYDRSTGWELWAVRP